MVGGLPKAPVAVVWSPLPSGSPTTKKNLPQNFFPGEKWVDWTGTDFYASYPEWGALTKLYERYPEKPFAITEWGVEAGDDPSFVSPALRLGRKPTRGRRCSSTTRTSARPVRYRIQNYAESLSVLTDRLHAGHFPAYAPGAPHLPPPPPGGVEAGIGATKAVGAIALPSRRLLRIAEVLLRARRSRRRPSVSPGGSVRAR